MIMTPVLVCEDCGSALNLRSYTYVRDGMHYAECIDLDLIAEAKTEVEAIGKLQEAMFGYVETVMEGAPQGLIPRPSPLLHRLRYHFHRLFDRRHTGHVPVTEGAVVEIRFLHCS
jgi:hypothetical protein